MMPPHAQALGAGMPMQQGLTAAQQQHLLAASVRLTQQQHQQQQQQQQPGGFDTTSLAMAGSQLQPSGSLDSGGELGSGTVVGSGMFGTLASGSGNLGSGSLGSGSLLAGSLANAPALHLALQKASGGTGAGAHLLLPLLAQQQQPGETVEAGLHSLMRQVQGHAQHVRLAGLQQLHPASPSAAQVRTLEDQTTRPQAAALRHMHDAPQGGQAGGTRAEAPAGAAPPQLERAAADSDADVGRAPASPASPGSIAAASQPIVSPPAGPPSAPAWGAAPLPPQHQHAPRPAIAGGAPQVTVQALASTVRALPGEVETAVLDFVASAVPPQLQVSAAHRTGGLAAAPADAPNAMLRSIVASS